MKQNEISEKAKKLYKTDIDYEEFEHELLHFRSLLISKYNEEKFTALKLLEIIYKNDLKSVFPNIKIILRIYISTPAINCTAERSFSSLKQIKT